MNPAISPIALLLLLSLLPGNAGSNPWTGAGQPLNLTLAPPWWQTWWFQGVLAAVGVALVAVGVALVAACLRWRLNAIETQKRALEQRIDSRTAELKQANSSLLREITERQRIEEDLREAELKVRLLTESASDGVISANSAGRIASWNRGAAHIFQYTAAEAIGQPLTLIMPQRYHEAHSQGLRRYLAGQGGHSLGRALELHGRRKDGSEFPLELSLSTWETREGQFFGAIIRDSSRRKLAEAALAQAKEAAEAANRAKSEFLANMSHELRTPLNAILGFAQLMNRADHRPPDDRENLQTIITSGEHLLALINDVLEMSKIEAGRISLHEQDFDLHRLLANLEDMFQLRARDKGLALRFEQTEALPRYIHADERKLRQVLINLLGNAVKFTPQGRVTLRVGVAGSESPPSQPPSARGRGQNLPPSGDRRRDRGGESGSQTSMSAPARGLALTFEIEDTGPGIAPEEQGRLFEAFVQTSSGRQMQEGTGLGLPISRQFVQLMGGDIAVRSEGIPGRGAIFAFTVRVTPVEAAALPETVSRRVVGLAPGQPEYRILVVEDKDINRRLLVKMLATLGFAVREAANGREAVEIEAAWQPHLIWMDMRMPVMDGYEATQRIRASTRGQAPVIIALTASAFEEQRAVVLSAGCDDFVRKPFRDGDLFEKMTHHLGVQFLYEAVDVNQAPPAESPDAAALLAQATLPDGWLAAVEYAAARAQVRQLQELIGQIQVNQPDLAAVLSDWVDNFEFKKIRILINPQTAAADL